MRSGLFSSSAELEAYILGAFPWLVAELWHVDQMHGGHFAAQTLADAGGVGGGADADYAAVTAVASSASSSAAGVSAAVVDAAGSATCAPAAPMHDDGDWPALSRDGVAGDAASATASPMADRDAPVPPPPPRRRRLHRSSLDRVSTLLAGAVLHDTRPPSTPVAHWHHAAGSPPLGGPPGGTGGRSRHNPGPAYVLPVSAAAAARGDGGGRYY